MKMDQLITGIGLTKAHVSKVRAWDAPEISGAILKDSTGAGA